MIEVPNGSIYFWMYEMGLKHVPLQEVSSAVRVSGKDIRKKDEENYWRGWQNSDLRSERDIFAVRKMMATKPDEFFVKALEDYPQHPYAGLPDIIQKWVPCSGENKPLIKWGEGCLTKIDALCYPGQVYLGENMRGCQTIVVDCDGDHNLPLDMRTISFLDGWGVGTHRLDKPKRIFEYEGYEQYADHPDCQGPASFHLTFQTDRVIPTMHFPYAGIDIVGNEKNSLRYWKNKKWNGVEPAWLTHDRWEALKEYIGKRREEERRCR